MTQTACWNEKKLRPLPAAAALLLLSCALAPQHTAELHEARVTAVVDGDTVQVQFTGDSLPAGCARSERVRLIGIDAPSPATEPPEHYAEEARSFMERYRMREVLVGFDAVSARRDKHGRLLAYIHPAEAPQESLNSLILSTGHGYYRGVPDFEPDRMEEFRLAEDEARTLRRGIWR